MASSETMPIDAHVNEAVAILRRGGLVAFPTETVYGLGADAENVQALQRLYAVKGRPGHHPVIVHFASLEQISEWATDIPAAAWELAKAFWPGPLTLILKRSERVPDAVTGGQDTVGLRVPAHPLALALLREFGGGVAAPSANRFGKLSPTTAAHVRADLGTDVDLILDGGACPVGVESTIVAFSDGQPVILRPGMITEAQIAAVLGSANKSEAEVDADSSEQSPRNVVIAPTVIRAPGTLASHYAPGTPLTLIPSGQLKTHVQQELSVPGQRIGVLAREVAVPALADDNRVVWVQVPSSPSGYASALYASLRELDALGLQQILVEEPPDTEAWAAVRDRLTRAAYRG